MSFRVQGRIDGLGVYDVEVTGEPANPVVGNKRVTILVKQWLGRTVAATPTGPTYTVDGADVRSILALLTVETDVRHVGEGAPDFGASRAGAIH